VRAAGATEISWDGRGEDGRPLGSGLYFMRADLGGKVFTHRLLLLK
jgi:hypothetical protein